MASKSMQFQIEFQYNLIKVSILADAQVAEEEGEEAALHHRGGHERHQEGEKAQ